MAEKAQTGYRTSIQPITGLQSKSTSPNKRRKILGGKSIDLTKASVPSGSNLENKALKKKTVDKLKTYEGLGLWNSITSQGADASGLTSAKDVTPSLERLREPLPCQGRKELINLAQEAMQSPNLGAASTPASNRKRVAASPGIMDKKLIYFTPMPLHSSGVPICGAGSLRNRGIKCIHCQLNASLFRHYYFHSIIFFSAFYPRRSKVAQRRAMRWNKRISCSRGENL